MTAGVSMSTREHIAWLAAYWRPHRRFLVFLFAFTLVSSAVASHPRTERRGSSGGVSASDQLQRPAS